MPEAIEEWSSGGTQFAYSIIIPSTPALQYSKKKWLTGCDVCSLVKLGDQQEILRKDSVPPEEEERGEGP
jgi:hypothetical protein